MTSLLSPLELRGAGEPRRDMGPDVLEDRLLALFEHLIGAPPPAASRLLALPGPVATGPGEGGTAGRTRGRLVVECTLQHPGIGLGDPRTTALAPAGAGRADRPEQHGRLVEERYVCFGPDDCRDTAGSLSLDSLSSSGSKISPPARLSKAGAPKRSFRSCSGERTGHIRFERLAGAGQLPQLG